LPGHKKGPAGPFDTGKDIKRSGPVRMDGDLQCPWVSYQIAAGIKSCAFIQVILCLQRTAVMAGSRKKHVRARKNSGGSRNLSFGLVWREGI